MTATDIVARLREAESGMVSDALARLRLEGWMDDVRPLHRPQRLVAGRARPLLMAPRRGDGAWPHSMYATIAMLEPGDILVLATGGVQQNVLGDNMVSFAASRGLAAIVTDAHVRDVAAIRGLPLPVFTRGPGTRIPLSLEPVALDIPVVCGGAQVRPGDYLAADEDGVVVVPGTRIEDVLLEIEEIRGIERELGDAIGGGAPVETIEGLIGRKKTPRAR